MRNIKEVDDDALKDLESQRPRNMIIDLEMQKIDPCCTRFKNCSKYFLKYYCTDKLSCPLMLLLLCSVLFMVLSIFLPDNKH